MQQHRPPYMRAKAKAKVQKDEGHSVRYMALFIATALLAVVISHNARAEGNESRPPTKAIWTDHNTHDPGLKVDPQKVRDMQAELAAEEAARSKQQPRDHWLLESFGISAGAQGF